MITVITVLFLFDCKVYANSNEILGKYTDYEYFAVFIRSLTIPESIVIDIGKTNVQAADVYSLEDNEYSLDTIILLDNSISIKTSDRDKITTIIRDLIAGKHHNERVAIATFDDQIHYLCNLTKDYGELKKACENIEYRNQDTCITSVLTDEVHKIASIQDGNLKRIILFSDGSDNSSAKYTGEELKELIAGSPFLIYCIGSKNKKGNNDEDLEKLFSLSRTTKGKYFVLEEYEDTYAINEQLDEDKRLIKIKVPLPDDICDGTEKLVRIKADNSVYETVCVMPYKAIVNDTQVSVAQKDEGILSKYFALIAVIASLIIMLIIMLGFVAATNKTSRKKGRQLISPHHIVEEQTVFLGDNRQNEEGTVMIWKKGQDNLVLTDRNDPSRTFKCEEKSVISIGRASSNDIVIDYDKSISGRHCEIHCKDRSYFVVDTGSSNYTYINNNRVTDRAKLLSGNILKLGKVELIFEVL